MKSFLSCLSVISILMLSGCASNAGIENKDAVSSSQTEISSSAVSSQPHEPATVLESEHTTDNASFHEAVSSQPLSSQPAAQDDSSSAPSLENVFSSVIYTKNSKEKRFFTETKDGNIVTLNSPDSSNLSFAIYDKIGKQIAVKSYPGYPNTCYLAAKSKTEGFFFTTLSDTTHGLSKAIDLVKCHENGEIIWSKRLIMNTEKIDYIFESNNGYIFTVGIFYKQDTQEQSEVIGWPSSGLGQMIVINKYKSSDGTPVDLIICEELAVQSSIDSLSVDYSPEVGIAINVIGSDYSAAALYSENLDFEWLHILSEENFASVSYISATDEKVIVSGIGMHKEISNSGEILRSVNKKITDLSNGKEKVNCINGNMMFISENDSATEIYLYSKNSTKMVAEFPLYSTGSIQPLPDGGFLALINYAEKDFRTVIRFDSQGNQTLRNDYKISEFSPQIYPNGSVFLWQ